MKNKKFSLTMETMKNTLVGVVDAETVIEMMRFVADIQAMTLCAITEVSANLNTWEFFTKRGREAAAKSHMESIVCIEYRLKNDIMTLVETTKNKVNATKVVVKDEVFTNYAKDCFNAISNVFTSRGYKKPLLLKDVID
jgi:hypothetical protein